MYTDIHTCRDIKRESLYKNLIKNFKIMIISLYIVSLHPGEDEAFYFFR